MPTYDYVCTACDHTWELFQQMTADPVKTCPECKKRKAKRLIGAGAGLVFKGSGFYETDYRSKGYKDAAAKDKKAAESGSESKSDSKSGVKSDAKKGGAEKKNTKKSSGKKKASE